MTRADQIIAHSLGVRIDPEPVRKTDAETIEWLRARLAYADLKRSRERLIYRAAMWFWLGVFVAFVGWEICR